MASNIRRFLGTLTSRWIAKRVRKRSKGYVHAVAMIPAVAPLINDCTVDDPVMLVKIWLGNVGEGDAAILLDFAF